MDYDFVANIIFYISDLKPNEGRQEESFHVSGRNFLKRPKKRSMFGYRAVAEPLFLAYSAPKGGGLLITFLFNYKPKTHLFQSIKVSILFTFVGGVLRAPNLSTNLTCTNAR